MPDITTTQIFSDGEKGITATKMNNIIANSVIQPDFVTAKPSSSTLDPTDQLLEVKGVGTYARITGQQLIDSVSASVTQNITPTIWSVRLRSLNAIGSPNFEVTQRNSGSNLVNPATGTFIEDRWQYIRSSAPNVNAQVLTNAFSATPIVVPGTNFTISQNWLKITNQAVVSSLAAADYCVVRQMVEGPLFRELSHDVHSISILARSSVANLSFGLSLVDASGTRTLSKLCSLGAANTITLLTLPNLPSWPTAGGFSTVSGQNAYILCICLAAGSSYTNNINDAWQNNNTMGALGQTNFCGQPIGSSIEIFFIQHQPGARCETLIDCPFTQNYDDCLRYYQKSFGYSVKPGTATYAGAAMSVASGVTYARSGVRFPKQLAIIPASTNMTLYPPNTGGAGGVLIDNTGTVIGATANDVDTSGIGSIKSTSNQLAAGNVVIFHYVMDTGW